MTSYTPLEIATASVFGRAGAFAVPRRAPHPRERLEAVLREALAAGPCAIAFSGGVDSSVLLALAMDVARREGLPEPVALTMVYADDQEADERAWQESIVRRLGVSDWERMRVGGEMNLLGPHARRMLRHVGLVYPPTLYQLLPMMDRLRGGTLVTGVDGDSAFAHPRYARARAVLFGGHRPSRRAAPSLLKALAPPAVRAAALSRAGLEAARLPWLRTAARFEYGARVAWDAAGTPVSWARRTASLGELREYAELLSNSHRLAELAGTRYVAAFLDGAFIGGLAAYGGRLGFTHRAEAVGALFGDLVPRRTVERRTKADTTASIWKDDARSFARGWNGAGVDTALVDSQALHTHWRQPRPWYGSTMLLHQAWLGAARERDDGVSGEGQLSRSQRA